MRHAVLHVVCAGQFDAGVHGSDQESVALMGILAWFSPTRWLLLLGLCLSLTAGYYSWRSHEQGIGYDKAVSEYTVKLAKAEQAARAKEQSLQAQITKAQDDAKTRETKLAADAASSKRTADSLRQQLASNNAKLSSLTRAAVDQYAATAGIVFAECAGTVTDLAAKVDAALSDVQTLLQAWPK